MTVVSRIEIEVNIVAEEDLSATSLDKKLPYIHEKWILFLKLCAAQTVASEEHSQMLKLPVLLPQPHNGKHPVEIVRLSYCCA